MARTGCHLAQFNWATLRFPIGDPRVAEFAKNVARMNRLAERMPGFVWRHLDDQKALAKLNHPGRFRRTALFTTTLSLWTDVDALRAFSFQTLHKRFYAKRADWFEPHDGPYIVLWWVPEGHRPGIPEAVSRAETLLKHGETEDAFGWPKPPGP